MKRLLLTGAAGSIGSVLRKKLAPLAEILRVSDINDLGDAAPNEEIVYCDLSKEDDVYKLVKGCNGIVHFGGISMFHLLPFSLNEVWSSIPRMIRAIYQLSSIGSKKTGEMGFCGSSGLYSVKIATVIRFCRSVVLAQYAGDKSTEAASLRLTI